MTSAKADVGDERAMAAIVAQAAASDMPLRGVIHAAGVLEDGLLMQQTPARLRAVMGPQGAGRVASSRLDARRAPLDFFVLYASAAGLLGSPGQGELRGGQRAVGCAGASPQRRGGWRR